MKTMDEAIKWVFDLKVPGNDEETLKRRQGEFADDVESCEFIHKIASHATTFAMGHMSDAREAGFQLFLNGFRQGVTVGVAMERQDVEGESGKGDHWGYDLAAVLFHTMVVAMISMAVWYTSSETPDWVKYSILISGFMVCFVAWSKIYLSFASLVRKLKKARRMRQAERNTVHFALQNDQDDSQ